MPWCVPPRYRLSRGRPRAAAGTARSPRPVAPVHCQSVRNARDAIAAKADGDSGGTRRIELRASALRADQTPSVARPGTGPSLAYLRSMSSTAVSAWMEPHASGSLSPSSRPSPLPAPPASDWQPPQSPSLFRIQTEQMMGDVHQEIVHCIFACLSADHQKPWALNDLSL